MLKHIFFDMDNTLMRSRSVMTDAHRELFGRLCKAKDVIVVSGAQESQIRSQVTKQLDGLYYILSQNGNYAVSKNGNVLWSEFFTDDQTSMVNEFIATMRRELGIKVRDENDLVENRGSQISYSLIGHHEDTDTKYAFDPGSVKRMALLASHPEMIRELKKNGVDVTPGGTTCLDFFLAGKHKGSNVKRLIEHEHWNREECIYIGDELQPGRNDSSVLGVVATQLVAGPHDTFEFIAHTLLT